MDGLFIFLGLLAVSNYFVPTLVALVRGHRQTLAIFLLNLFAGWTLIGWVGALVWAALRRTPEFGRGY